MKKIGFSFLILSIILLSGCLSPATLRPVAEQNATNIHNYAMNVELAAKALKKGLSLHAALHEHVLRKNLTTRLMEIKREVLINDPNSPVINDISKPWYKWLKGRILKLKDRMEKVENDEKVLTSLAAEEPAIIDVAMNRPGFTIGRVLRDSILLDNQNMLLSKESNGAVRRAMYAKRQNLLDEYFYIKSQQELNKTYLLAIDQYLEVLREQGDIAKTHANAILAYAKSQTKVSVGLNLLQDKELRDQILNIVKEKKGEASAEKIKNHLSKLDEAIEIIKIDN